MKTSIANLILTAFRKGEAMRMAVLKGGCLIGAILASCVACVQAQSSQPWYEAGNVTLSWSPVQDLPTNDSPRQVGAFLDLGSNTWFVSDAPAPQCLWVAGLTTNGPVDFRRFPITYAAGWTTQQLQSLTMNSIAATANGTIYIGSSWGVLRLNPTNATVDLFWWWSSDPSYVRCIDDQLWWYVANWGANSGIHRWRSTTGYEYVYPQDAAGRGGSVLDAYSGAILATNGAVNGFALASPQDGLVLKGWEFSTDHAREFYPYDQGEVTYFWIATRYSGHVIIGQGQAGGNYRKLQIGALGSAFYDLAVFDELIGAIHYHAPSRNLIVKRAGVFYAAQLPPPPPLQKVSICIKHQTAVVQWIGEGNVSEASGVAGPWLPHAGAKSPYVTPAIDQRKFIKLLPRE